MAQPVALGDVLRLRVACYTATQASVNVVHFKVTTLTGTGQTDAQVAAAFNTTLAPRYKLALSAQARFRGVSIQRIIPAPPTLAQVDTSLDGVGGVAGDLMPTQTCGVVASLTDFAGVAYRGRVYIPFPGEASNTSAGLPDPAYVSLIDDIGDELFTSIVIGGAPNQATLTPCLYHRQFNNTTSITSFIARGKWGTQRRRGSYGRTNPTPF